MASEIISQVVARGISNKQLKMAMDTALTAYEPLPTDASGYPQVDGFDGLLFKTDLLSRMINNKIFVDGKGVTERTGFEGQMALTDVETAFPPQGMRRLKTNKSDGTEGNNGFVNSKMATTPQETWNELTLDLIYDPDIAVSVLQEKISQGSTKMSLLAEASADLPRVQADNEDVTIMVMHLLTGLYKATQNGKKNLVGIGTGKNLKGNLISLTRKVIHPVVAWADKQKTFSEDKSIVIVRESLYQDFFGSDGVIFGCDLGQKMLQEGKLYTNGEVGNLTADGVIGRTLLKAVPDYMWDLAKVIACDTEEEAKQFDNVLGYVANADGFTLGRAETSIDQQKLGRWDYILPAFRWGVTTTRGNACSLLMKAKDDLSDFTVLDSFKTKQDKFNVPYSMTEHAKELGIEADYGDVGGISAKVGASS